MTAMAATIEFEFLRSLRGVSVICPARCCGKMDSASPYEWEVVKAGDTDRQVRLRILGDLPFLITESGFSCRSASRCFVLEWVITSRFASTSRI